MATPANLAQAAESGVLPELDADPGDLLVTVAGTAAGCAAALASVDGLLAGPRRVGAPGGSLGEAGEPAVPLRSIAQAVAHDPGLDLALISVPGAYAAAEARKALRHGLHVMLFSDNVSVADEVALKDEAAERGLLLMGPDCGTAIVNGVPLGFANEVRRGAIGVVGASGTGLQEVTARAHRLSGGISQAFGTGGRDLGEAVAARSTLRALAVLGADPATEVIVVVSKPPAPVVRARVLAAAGALAKPVVVAYIGDEPASPAEVGRVVLAGSLAEAADLAMAFLGGAAARPTGPVRPADAVQPARPGEPGETTTSQPSPGAAATGAPALTGAGRRWVRGSFAGGSFCAEALAALTGLGLDVADHVGAGAGHRLVDFGADELTRGRPHPMIDPTLRDEQVAADAADPATAVVLFDVVLGHGAAADPVSGLLARLDAVRAAGPAGGLPPLVAHVCGTEGDPQDRNAVIEQLRAAGVHVSDSNIEAARLAGALVTGRAPAPLVAHAPGPSSARPVEPRAAATPVGLLRPAGLGVVSLGLDAFDGALRRDGVTLHHLDWRPPARGVAADGRRLAALVGHPVVEEANRVAFARLLAADPVLVGVGRAGDVIDGLAGARRLLHAGPPIDWAEMCGPMQGALIGAALAERWASSAEGAAALLAQGGIELEPCHHHAAVGPMAGVIGPSMPVWVVEDPASGRRAFSNLNEGLGAVLRFGANGPEVIDRLDWMAAELADVLAAALARLGPLPLKPLMAQALHMGDEVHNRNVAATGLLLRRLVPALLGSGVPVDRQERAVAFIAANDHFFLNLSMAACKVSLDAAAGVPGSSLVTAMARNGVRFGVRTSGTGDTWFEAPAGAVDGLYFSGYGPADAAADLGDSAITETAGLGGFAMAAAPAIVQFVGGNPADAIAHSRAMGHITLGANPAFSLPALDFAPVACGIDTRAVVDTGVLPVINTGIAHRWAGVGQIGAGITHAPEACFIAAVAELARRLGCAAEHGPGEPPAAVP
jgi:succinyl-CoA synthetase alpha subunit